MLHQHEQILKGLVERAGKVLYLERHFGVRTASVFDDRRMMKSSRLLKYSCTGGLPGRIELRYGYIEIFHRGNAGTTNASYVDVLWTGRDRDMDILDTPPDPVIDVLEGSLVLVFSGVSPNGPFDALHATLYVLAIPSNRGRITSDAPAAIGRSITRFPAP